MRESAEDLARLERLLASSIEQAGEFLRRAFEMPDHSLSASQLCAYLDGQPVVALGTTTAAGEPRVAPVAAVFYRARFLRAHRHHGRQGQARRRGRGGLV